MMADDDRDDAPTDVENARAYLVKPREDRLTKSSQM